MSSVFITPLSVEVRRCWSAMRALDTLTALPRKFGPRSAVSLGPFEEIRSGDVERVQLGDVTPDLVVLVPVRVDRSIVRFDEGAHLGFAERAHQRESQDSRFGRDVDVPRSHASQRRASHNPPG